MILKFKHLTLVTALAATMLTNPSTANAYDDIDDAIKASEALSQARLLPRDIFLDRHIIRAIRLSPNGEKLAFVTNEKKYSKLWLHDVASGENNLLFTSEIMNSVHWSADGDYLIMETANGIASAPVSDAASPAYIVKLNMKNSEVFHGVDDTSPHHIFVSLYDKDSEQYTLTRVDMDGNQTPLYTDKNKLYNFLAEPNGPLKFVTRTEGLRQKLYQIENGVESEIFECRYNEGCSAASYNAETNSVYMYSRLDGDLQGLAKLDIDTKTVTSVHSDPENRFDIDDVFFSASGDPILIEYDTDYRESYGIGSEMSAHVETIKSKIQSKIIHIKPRSEKTWLVINSDPTSPSHTEYLYDLKTRTLAQPLSDFVAANPVQANPVTPDEVAISTAFWHEADDGFMLQGYLTLPRGVDISKAPMVVVPHGGPWNRTYGAFSSNAQILANRGYIVYQPNFRASTGFGKAYILESKRDFGDGRTQDDIINGTNYLLSRGIGDKDKLAMYGHSFGGFSTMAALAFTPDMFQVGIAGAPPPSLSKTMEFYIKNQDQTRAGVLRKDVMADLAVDIDDPQDIKRLYSQSPDNHVSKVTKPMYIWAGEKDDRVNILEVRNYAVKLEENGGVVGMLTDKNAGHSPRKPMATEAYLYMLETVLAKHLGGRHQPLTNKKLIKYLEKNMVMGNLPVIEE